VLVRTDGTPTYNFASAVDDADMGITHVIRGDDHLSNTPKQIVVFESLGHEVPVFGHLSMILGADGKRLSKRHGATSVEAYRDLGYLPEALLNYLALLGWSLDDKTTVISAETLTENFSLDRVSKNPAVFDDEKLEWLNGVYIREMPLARLADIMSERLISDGLLDPNEVGSRRSWLEGLASLVRERIKRLDEIAPTVRFLFADEIEIEDSALEKVLAKPGAKVALLGSLEVLGDVQPFEHDAIEGALRSVPEKLGLKPKIVFQAVRVAITGSAVSPPLFESLALLGRDRTLDRIHKALPLAAEQG
jgi:glutamyl-tRNA synthetase